MNRISAVSLLILLLVSVCAGCSGENKFWLHKSDKWLNPEYRNTEYFHGAVVVRWGGTTVCTFCHGRKLEGRKTDKKTAPGCTTCHFGTGGGRAPQGSTWVHGFNDHPGQESVGAVCDACHKVYQSNGLEPTACHTCHKQGVEAHELGQPWLDPKNPEYHGNSGMMCRSCHLPETKCATCHFGPSGSKTPSGLDWKHGTTPHESLAPYEAVCTTCHALERSYSNGPASCHDCHGHPLGQSWLDRKSPDFHKTSTLQCSACHDMNVKCATCHFGQEGSKTPDPGWTHGTLPHDNATLTINSTQEAVCTTCHTLNRTYGNGPVSCHDCHVHEKGQSWLDKKSPDYHGTSSMECLQCHSSAGVTTKCANCHFDNTTGSKTPPGSDWVHGDIPHDNETLPLTAGQQAVCAACHTTSRSYGNGPAACHDCHGHPLGQPWLDRKSPDFHKTSTLQCSTCHDMNVKCATCHFGQEGSKTPDPGWTHGTLPHDNATLTINSTQEAVCTTCHTLNRSYGNGPVACHDCHTHEKGQPWLDKKEPGYHGVSTGTMDCAACHDNPAVVTKCAGCHFDDTTGSKTPPGSDWEHGDLQHDNETLPLTAGQQSVCAACHTTSRSYGNGPVACHDCHMHEKGQPWLDKKESGYHGVSTGTMDCAACHANPAVVTKCAGCHFDDTTGSKTPPGLDWEHGDIPHDNETLPLTAGQQSVCAACHTTSRNYGNGPAACHDCHMHEKGQPWLDKKEPGYHGASTIQCSSCHDKPAVVTKCANCHFDDTTGSKTPDPGWEHGDIPHDNETLPLTAGQQSVCAACHTTSRNYGNGPAACHDCHIPHAVPFVPLEAHRAMAKQNLVACQICHATPSDGGAGSNPRFNDAMGSYVAGCESSGCHKAFTAHPVPWDNATRSHQTAGNMENACTLCHGASFAGGTGPACSTCHTRGLPTVKKNCTSCHSSPPSTGAHSAHNALPEVANVCSTCHSGAGSGSVNHKNGTVEVTIAGYVAKDAVTATYSAVGKTCSGVSCHGGNVTLRWDTGVIDVNTQCTTCHSNSINQYNSYTSWGHTYHVAKDCTDCHSITQPGAEHFDDLATTQMPEAAQTILPALGYDGSTCNYCHGRQEYAW